MIKPFKNHWMAAKRVLRYGNTNFSIKYTYYFDLKLIGYSYSDCGGNMDYRRSTAPYAFNIGLWVICWSNKNKSIIFSHKQKKSICMCNRLWILVHDALEEQKYATTTTKVQSNSQIIVFFIKTQNI